MQNRFLIATELNSKLSNFDIMQASTQKQAEIMYNVKYNCTYMLGTCVAQIVDGKVAILNENITIADLIKYLNVKIVCTAEENYLL